MQTKPLLFGLIGFFIGGLLVSIAATTFEKPNEQTINSSASMQNMSASLEGRSGDDYDKAFITEMIAHHEGAVSMAELSAEKAKHQEIKQLSTEIIAAQEKEITQMKQWQKDWGYSTSTTDGKNHNSSNTHQ